MALTQVRVKLGEEWTVLAYNEETGRYEGTVTPSNSSAHETGGYFSLTAEVTDEGGEVAAVTGEQLAALRLVVREVTAPALTLLSPAPGFLTTASPVFVFYAEDEAGGSGVDPTTVKVTLDGSDAACTVEADGDGYKITLVAESLADGPHTVVASVSDYDGNESTASAAYTVDTAPPRLYLRKPYQRHVFDVEEIEVAAAADDENGVASVSIGGETVTEGAGLYARTVPLEVGENFIEVAVTDAAGNRTAETVYAIRLITDRTAEDLERLEELHARGMENWTAEELEWYNTAVTRGGYLADDLNRVGVAVEFLASELTKRGYVPAVSGVITGWTDSGCPAQSQMDTYLDNVERVRAAQGLVQTEIPSTMRKLTLDGANRVEKALVETDSVFPRYAAWSSGEISSGGF